MGMRLALVFDGERFYHSSSQLTTHNTWGYKELCFFPFYVTIRVKNCILLLFTSRVLFCIGCFPLCITLRRDVCSDFGRNFKIAAGTTMLIRLLLSP
jgi:hypothetical protein